MIPRLLFTSLLAGLSITAAAQSYPVKPIRLVVTYPPGGSTDVVARALALRLTGLLGQQIVVDNRGGAGGIIGTEIVAHAMPDGYTLLFGTSAGICINPLLHRKLSYDVQRDLAPVSLVVVNPQVLVAYPGFPANTVAQLIKVARARPGQINYASPGVGSPNHMGMELLKSMAGINLVHVPYKGGGPAMMDLVSGRVSLLFNSIPSVLPQMKAGKLKALAVGSGHRSPAIPDVPTVAESGVSGFEYATWYGIFVPAATPRAVIARANKAIVSALKNPELARQLAAKGSEPRPSTPDELARFARSERERWAHVVKMTGIRIRD